MSGTGRVQLSMDVDGPPREERLSGEERLLLAQREVFLSNSSLKIGVSSLRDRHKQGVTHR